MKAQLLISVVDDDESVRESLPELLKELGFDARTFSSAREFLASDAPLHSNCLILDVAMPGKNSDCLHYCSQGRSCTVAIVK